MRLLTMVLAVAVLAAAPLFMTSYLLGVLTNGLIAALFALAFNLLAGQAGLLSFGHAAYFSAGGFAVIHLMKAVESGRVSFPTPLLPLVGGLAGLLSGNNLSLPAWSPQRHPDRRANGGPGPRIVEHLAEVMRSAPGDRQGVDGASPSR